MHWIKQRGPGLHGTFPTDRERSRESLLRSILNKVEGQPNGCVLWTGSVMSAYGAISVGYRRNTAGKWYRITRRAHRVVWELFVGPLPEGLCLDHFTCFNKLCVNPAHLDIVTSPENVRRAFERMTHCVNGHEFTAENTMIRAQHNNKNQRMRQCKLCRQAFGRDSYYKNQEKNAARAREYNRAHAEKIRQRNIENAEAIRAYRREYYQKNKQALLARMADRRNTKKLSTQEPV